MKVINLKPVGGNNSLYSFSLNLEGFVLRGFLYNTINQQIVSPSISKRQGAYGTSSYGRMPVVWAHGIFWQKLQLLLQFMLDKQYKVCDHRTMELELIEKGRK